MNKTLDEGQVKVFIEVKYTMCHSKFSMLIILLLSCMVFLLTACKDITDGRPFITLVTK